MLVLVRHAEAEFRTATSPPEAERPLTPRGRRDALALVDRLVGYGPTFVVSSPYRRAVDTVAPTAAALGVPVATRADLREWDDGLGFVEDFLPLYEQCWLDPDHRFGEGESHRELTGRAGDAICELVDQSRAGTVIAASHGNWIARGLGAIGSPASRDFWRAMPNPAVYEIEAVDGVLQARGPGLA